MAAKAIYVTSAIICLFMLIYANYLKTVQAI